MVKLTTEKVMLRNIPQLDLSAFKTSEWINLEEIDLRGYSSYLMKQLSHFVDIVQNEFIKNKNLILEKIFRFTKRLYYFEKQRRN